MSKVLVLGSGMVAGPLISYLLNKGIYITVASNTKERAEELVGNHPKGEIVFWEADDKKGLNDLIAKHDLVVSLLPFAFHVDVAEVCVKHKKNMVTTSYVQPKMKDLDEAAKEAGIIILNECGLDPGIDHMSAKRIIDTVQGFGGKITEFYSITGALAAPEFAVQNPFKYKFSWSPKGVLLAGNNDAEYLKNNKVVKIESKDLFKHTFELEYRKVGTLEAYPNRTSMPYIDLYDLKDVHTMYRGTFRFLGWCKIMDAFKTLGLTSIEHKDFSKMTFAQMIAELIGSKSTDDLVKNTAKFLKVPQKSEVIDALDYLGLFDEKPMNRTKDSAFEIVSDLMIGKMMLQANEQDMCVMQHVFLAEYPDGKQEVIRSRLLDYGTPDSDTSIARTVALPAASAVKMILDGEISVKGVHIPVLPEIYNPILIELENLGIEMVEEYGLPLSKNISLG